MVAVGGLVVALLLFSPSSVAVGASGSAGSPDDSGSGGGQHVYQILPDC